MSIPTAEQANRFLFPLKGRLPILLLHDTQSKLLLSRFILACASLHSLKTTVLDTDAFYCTNMEQFVDEESLPTGQVVLLPERDFEVISMVPLLSSRRGMLIIDDVNSLYSLASDGRRSQQLAILFRLLSHNARMNGSWVVATAYRADLAQRRGANQRLLTALGDLVIDTKFLGGSVQLRAGLKDIWSNGEYSL
jgi:hypothetical protein